VKRLIAEWENGHGRRLTLGALADATGVYRTTLARIAGPRSFNTTTQIDLLCRFFKCKIEELVEYVDEPPAKR
jgi:putative transcriptional regulator